MRLFVLIAAIAPIPLYYAFPDRRALLVLVCTTLCNFFRWGVRYWPLPGCVA